MTSPRNRLASYALLLVGLFAGAYAVGERLPGDDHDDAAPPTHAHDGSGDTEMSAAPDGASSADLLGLSSVVAGHRLVIDEHTADVLRFHLERDGATVTDFVERHGALVHLLLVRRDLSGYQHLHPTIDVDGEWTAAVDLAAPGAWRVVVDAEPVGVGSTLALGTDVVVPGEMVPVELAEPASMVHADDRMVARDGLHFTIEPASGLEPYLGQAAHLVAFRDGDLAYVHLHPDGDVLGDVAFSSPLPGPGRYRLFFQFVADGDVVTAEFTVVQP